MTAKVFVDNNIFIDVFTANPDFLSDSKAVLKLCEQNVIEGYTTASAITDIFYLIRKLLHDRERAYQALGHILNIVKVLPVTNEDVLNAYAEHAPDFVDCLQATCAKANHCSAIVTRDEKGFKNFGITLLSPSAVVDQYKAE
ncbi:MAG: PIN domain-containing protein [Oscillospiraceae bacterium]|nr:PIN domain-containing protein [Oscillospiraceae bacterium]